MKYQLITSTSRPASAEAPADRLAKRWATSGGNRAGPGKLRARHEKLPSVTKKTNQYSQTILRNIAERAVDAVRYALFEKNERNSLPTMLY